MMQSRLGRPHSANPQRDKETQQDIIARVRARTTHGNYDIPSRRDARSQQPVAPSWANRALRAPSSGLPCFYRVPGGQPMRDVLDGSRRSSTGTLRSDMGRAMRMSDVQQLPDRDRRRSAGDAVSSSCSTLWKPPAASQAQMQSSTPEEGSRSGRLDASRSQLSDPRSGKSSCTDSIVRLDGVSSPSPQLSKCRLIGSPDTPMDIHSPVRQRSSPLQPEGTPALQKGRSLADLRSGELVSASSKKRMLSPQMHTPVNNMCALSDVFPSSPKRASARRIASPHHGLSASSKSSNQHGSARKMQLMASPQLKSPGMNAKFVASPPPQCTAASDRRFHNTPVSMERRFSPTVRAARGADHAVPRYLDEAALRTEDPRRSRPLLHKENRSPAEAWTPASVGRTPGSGRSGHSGVGRPGLTPGSRRKALSPPRTGLAGTPLRSAILTPGQRATPSSASRFTPGTPIRVPRDLSTGRTPGVVRPLNGIQGRAGSPQRGCTLKAGLEPRVAQAGRQSLPRRRPSNAPSPPGMAPDLTSRATPERADSVSPASVSPTSAVDADVTPTTAATNATPTTRASAQLSPGSGGSLARCDTGGSADTGREAARTLSDTGAADCAQCLRDSDSGSVDTVVSPAPSPAKCGDETPFAATPLPCSAEELEGLHKCVEKGDLDALQERLPHLRHRLSIGDREYLEREQMRLERKAKRAATESLHAAMRSKDAGKLRKALASASRRSVPEDDVEEATEVLEKLLAAEARQSDFFASSGPDQGAAAQCFRAIACDDIGAVQKLMRQAAWGQWRDPEGRDLLAAADAAEAEQVLRVLAAGRGKTHDQEFKYVMRDDELALEESLRGVSPFVWGRWKNKGGKSLLELADERGKPKCYTWLALASGKVQFLQPEQFAAGDSVWVFSQASLQPRPARVEEADDEACAPPGHVRVAFWDEDSSVTRHVDATHLRKMAR